MVGGRSGAIVWRAKGVGDRGDIDRALTIRAHAFSAAARAKIEQAGGKAEVVG